LQFDREVSGGASRPKWGPTLRPIGCGALFFGWLSAKRARDIRPIPASAESGPHSLSKKHGAKAGAADHQIVFLLRGARI
jgi:hypothetical protein